MRDVLSLMSEDQFNTIKKYARKYEINFYHMLYYCIYRPRYYCITTAEKKYEAIRTMRYIFKYFFDFVCHFMDNNPELDWSCINYADSFFYFLEDYDDNSRAYVQKAQKEIEQELAEHKGENQEPLKLKTGTFKKPFYFTHQYCEYSQYYEETLLCLLIENHSPTFSEKLNSICISQKQPGRQCISALLTGFLRKTKNFFAVVLLTLPKW